MNLLIVLLLIVIAIPHYSKYLVPISNNLKNGSYQQTKRVLKQLAPLFFLSICWALVLGFLFDIQSYKDFYMTLWMKPRSLEGLYQIITMNFVHGSIQHIISNTTHLVVYTMLIFLFFDRNKILKLYVFGIIGSGLFVFLFGRSESLHGGASGIVFTLITYVIVAGFLDMENLKRLAVAAMIFITQFSSIFLGLLPYNTGISWEGHLGGALAAIIFILIDEKIIKLNYKLKIEKL